MNKATENQSNRSDVTVEGMALNKFKDTLHSN